MLALAAKLDGALLEMRAVLLQLVQPPTARCGEHGPQRADRLEGALTHARSGRQLQLLMPQSTRQIAHVCAWRRSGGSVDSVGVSLLEAPHEGESRSREPITDRPSPRRHRAEREDLALVKRPTVADYAHITPYDYIYDASM